MQNLILEQVLFLSFFHFSEWIMLPAHPLAPPYVKILIFIAEEKKLNENSVKFYFRMGAVLVILAFF